MCKGWELRVLPRYNADAIDYSIFLEVRSRTRLGTQAHAAE